jgi:hypothetical protein
MIASKELLIKKTTTSPEKQDFLIGMGKIYKK